MCGTFVITLHYVPHCLFCFNKIDAKEKGVRWNSEFQKTIKLWKRTNFPKISIFDILSRLQYNDAIQLKRGYNQNLTFCERWKFTIFQPTHQCLILLKTSMFWLGIESRRMIKFSERKLKMSQRKSGKTIHFFNSILNFYTNEPTFHQYFPHILCSNERW